MEQTAIEWLVENAEDFFGGLIAPSIIDQAKAMERSQKAEEYLKGFKDGKEYQIKLDELTFKSE
jgi:hypothetical protein